MIIGITGKMRHGKDAVAQAILQQRNTFERVGFADQLKDLALRVDPVIPIETAHGETPVPEERILRGGNISTARLTQVVDWSQGWEVAKDRYPEVRRMLQALGTGAREALGPEVWVDAWERRAIGKLLRTPYLTTLPYPDVVVPDTRFLNEARRIADHHGVIVRVVRPAITSSDTHISETEMDRIVVDHTIVNDGSLEDLNEKVADLLDLIGI